MYKYLRSAYSKFMDVYSKAKKAFEVKTGLKINLSSAKPKDLGTHKDLASRSSGSPTPATPPKPASLSRGRATSPGAGTSPEDLGADFGAVSGRLRAYSDSAVDPRNVKDAGSPMKFLPQQRAGLAQLRSEASQANNTTFDASNILGLKSLKIFNTFLMFILKVIVN